jgi:pyruvate/2-oxoglutarate dehydrogenase complex dihydrolipoamide dehydrogenase (E3) component
LSLAAAQARGDLGRVEQHRHEREMLAAEIASAVFGRPPIGVVGLTEVDARAKLGGV